MVRNIQKTSLQNTIGELQKSTKSALVLYWCHKTKGLVIECRSIEDGSIRTGQVLIPKAIIEQPLDALDIEGYKMVHRLNRQDQTEGL